MTSTTIAGSGRPIERIGNDPSVIVGVPIKECGDPLVEVVEEPRIFVEPAYHRRNIPSAPNQVVIRRGVLERLRRAAATLPDGTGLLLWDGLRSLETQQAIVEAFRASLPEEQRDDEEVLQTYLAPPPSSEEEFRADPPPHATGGAIDLTLCDRSGKPFDMGADFDEFAEPAWLAHFDSCPDDGPPLTVAYRNRRRMLYWAMIGAGFAPYPWEFWHFEFGTMVAANFYSQPVATYGVAVPWRSPW